MKRLIAPLLVAALFLAGPAHGDLFLKYEKTTAAYQIMGQTVPEKKTTATTWVGADKARFDDGENMSAIMDGKAKTLTIVDHGRKTFMVMPLDDKSSLMDKAIQEKAGSPEEAAKMKQAMQGMMGAMNMQMTVTPTGEKKKIDKWDCTRYDVNVSMSLGSSKSEVWATEQIKIDRDRFNRVRNFGMAGQPGFEQMQRESEKIKGVPVLSVSTARVMNTDVKTTEKLVEQAEKSPPAGTYDVPKGYKEQKGFAGGGPMGAGDLDAEEDEGEDN